jgi:hypothetical protein
MNDLIVGFVIGCALGFVGFGVGWLLARPPQIHKPERFVAVKGPDDRYHLIPEDEHLRGKPEGWTPA